MTNFERMTDEEKKLAIMYGNGIFITNDGEVKACPQYIYREEIMEVLNAEYIEPKTENEKFCETLKVGEVIVVWDDDIQPRVRAFHSYDKETDSIRCIRDGILKYTSNYGCMPYEHGRKLNAEDRGE